MKNHYKFLILSLVLVLFSVNSLQSQRKNRVVKKADQQFDAQMYFEASELYKKGYKKTKNKAIKAEILFKQAECYRHQNKYPKAANFYKKAIKAKYDNSNAISLYWYAKMLMSSGNYEKAVTQFEKYSKKVPTDTRAEKGLQSCQFAINWMQNPTRHEIYYLPQLNSGKNDFSPAWGNKDYNKLYFVSSRKGSSNDKIDERTGEYFFDIYSSELKINRKNEKLKIGKPKRLESPINTENHEGTLCLNKNGTTMFFTTCQVENKKQLGCEIAISQLKGKTWGPLNKLEVKIDSNSTIGHPTISPDGQQIIFSAELPSGLGGTDLWMVTRIGRGQWSEPANLGPGVNTDGDEKFPFLHHDGSLYFASDGWVGMGGLDIFKAELDANGIYSESINLKYPINSASDDFGMIIDDTEKGFFASNRRSGIKEDQTNVKLNGSDNIFWFKLPPLVLTLQGVVTDTKTKSIITGANVKLVGDDNSSVEVITDNTGTYYFDSSRIKPLTSYEIIVTKDGYLKNKISVTTVGIENNEDIIKDITLDPIFKDIRLPRIYYDFAKWDLRDTSKLDLDRVYDIMIENPEIVIQLNSHTDFRGENLSNVDLSQKRANACVNYLIQKGISSDRMVAFGKGEENPYVITKYDHETHKSKGIFKKKIFKEGQILSEDYINSLKKEEYKQIAHQLNRRTTFKVISQSYDPEFEKLFRNSISNLPEINQTPTKNKMADFVWNVENDCEYSITVYYNGLTGGSTVIESKQTASIKLIPGEYRIVAFVNNKTANVKPFSGVRTLQKGYQADTRFYIY